MTFPSGSLTVIGCRDFHDVPRFILGMDELSNYWIFDCAFDDDMDEYPDEYKVYVAGHDRKDAEHVMKHHLMGTTPPAS